MCPWGTFSRVKNVYVKVPNGHTLKSDKSPAPRNLIGPRLKELRRAARPRISQEDLCGRIAQFGVILSRTQIAKIESGRRPVMDFELAAFAQALRVELHELMPQMRARRR